MKKKYILLFCVIGFCFLCGCEQNTVQEQNITEEEYMDEFISSVNININGIQYIATLEDNETAREFSKMLPLTISMSELNRNEKYYYLNTLLPTNSKIMSKINKGDIMLYGNDCLVIFYETFNTSYSYTRIGKIDDPTGLKEAVGNSKITITISK